MKNALKLIGIAALLATTSLSAHATTLKIATDSGAKGSPAGDAIEMWAKGIEEGTNGDLKVNIFYQNELGGQQEVFDLLVAGDIDIMLNWPMTSYSPRIAAIYTPYMFTTWDEALTAYKPGGWLHSVVSEVYEDVGVKFFGAWPEGFNGVATKSKVAQTVDEAKSIKVRVPPVFPFTETVSAMGYQTATIDWAELYSAIQTGVVDGEAANVIFYDNEYFGDILKFYNHNKMQFITGMLSMNADKWDALTVEQQTIVQEMAIKVMQKQFDEAKAQDEAYIQAWKDRGNTYYVPSDEELKPIAQTVRDTVWPQMEKALGAEIMTKIKDNSKAF